MKSIFTLIFTIYIPFGFADIYNPGGETLYRIPEDQNKDSSRVDPSLNSNGKIEKSNQGKNRPTGNLPSYLRNRKYSNMKSISTQTQIGNTTEKILRSAKIGDKYSIRVLHGVLAFPGEKSPVVAVVTQRGSLMGARIVGYSYLEPNSKKVCFNFKTITKSDTTYSFDASGVDGNEQMCIKGRYYSQDTEIFTGAFISSFIGAYFDAKAPSNTNIFGLENKDTRTDIAIKKGLGGAATRSADELFNRIKKSPEFSEVKGPFLMKIIVLSQALELTASRKVR